MTSKQKLIRDLTLKHSVNRKLEDGQEFGASIMSFINRVNHNSSEMKSAIHLMANDHPTLQQNLMRFFLMFVEELAKKDAVDLRNQDSVELAKEILRKIPDVTRNLSGY